MESKSIVVGIVVGLFLGIVFGYSAIAPQISSQQSQLSSLQSQVISLQLQVSTLQTEKTNLQIDKTNLQKQVTDRDTAILAWQKALAERDAIITDLRKQLQPQSGTVIKIESVRWEINDDIVRVLIKNIGSTSAIIESIKIRKNIDGAQWYFSEYQVGPFIFPSSSNVYVWKEASEGAPSDFLSFNTSYWIKVTCDTGFYDEEFFTSPPS